MNNKTNDIEVSIDTEQTTATLSKLLKILLQGNDIKLHASPLCSGMN
jgi:hypothetical protein